MTFWEQLTKLCVSHGISPSKLCKEIGLSNATATHWKNGTKPTEKSLKLIADYFKMSELELAQHFFAISLFDCPSTISFRTSYSLCVRLECRSLNTPLES